MEKKGNNMCGDIVGKVEFGVVETLSTNGVEK